MPKAAFDKIAGIYDSTIPGHIRDHYLFKRADFIENRFKPGLVLDVGSGTGLLAQQLNARGFRVVGLDVSWEMLNEASKRGGKDNICSTAVDLPFKADSFDLVISIASFHHLAGSKMIFLALREMVRVAKPRGHILIWDHNPLNPYWRAFMKRLPQDAGVERTIPLSEIIEDLKETGDYEITASRLGFMPDFIPVFLLKPFKILEKIVEATPLLNKLCAHNVIIAKKG